ncbi:uncharacterized protein MONBRDRAFT_22589 [Monosiga brevicollis MX1]|uniref:CAP-Gly domain-containing protein n=1 Tax=Monosiga brevicollis TaxID=81824 RepID=A9UR15_MONBE|nr:uncharacterized protein MONBRDRAFT_22589 [Monosiga brevicollis MX1]EDQ93139.1 predicted protein [Monosiga brevicollis MX1]|eukprot:XP_001742901.1 hypothetical protein [Monosiga brevicollis MX1]
MALSLLLTLGCRVRHAKGGEGIIRFIGDTDFQEVSSAVSQRRAQLAWHHRSALIQLGLFENWVACIVIQGVWVGIELDEPNGKNDGTVNGKQYFEAPPQHGLFARPDKLELLAPYDPAADMIKMTEMRDENERLTQQLASLKQALATLTTTTQKLEAEKTDLVRAREAQEARLNSHEVESDQACAALEANEQALQQLHQELHAAQQQMAALELRQREQNSVLGKARAQAQAALAQLRADQTQLRLDLGPSGALRQEWASFVLDQTPTLVNQLAEFCHTRTPPAPTTSATADAKQAATEKNARAAQAAAQDELQQMQNRVQALERELLDQANQARARLAEAAASSEGGLQDALVEVDDLKRQLAAQRSARSRDAQAVDQLKEALVHKVDATTTLLLQTLSPVVARNAKLLASVQALEARVRETRQQAMRANETLRAAEQSRTDLQQQLETLKQGAVTADEAHREATAGHTRLAQELEEATQRLKDQKTSFNKERSKLLENLQTSKADLAAAKDEQAAREATCKRLEKEVQSLTQAKKELEAHVAAQQKESRTRIDALESQVHEISDERDALRQQVASLQASVDSGRSEKTALESKFADLLQKRDRLVSLQEDYDHVVEELSTFREQVTCESNLRQERLTAVEKENGTLKTEIEKLRREHDTHLVQQNREHAEAMKTQEAEHQQKLKQSEEKVKMLASQLKATLAKLKEQQAAAAEETRTHQETVEAHAQELSNRDAALLDLQAQLKQEAASVAEREADVTSAKAALAEQAQLVASKEEEIAELSQQLAEAVTHISTTKIRIEQLEQSFETVYLRLQTAVEKGAVPPVAPAEIKAFSSAVASLSRDIAISIPRVVKVQGGHQAFEIYVTVGTDQWIIYRRYSELLAFQREIRKQFPNVDRLEFPAKTFGSVSPAVTAERRKKLQTFLQSIVEIAVELEGTPVQQERSKTALVLTLPIFAEDRSSMAAVTDFDDEEFVQVD